MNSDILSLLAEGGAMGPGVRGETMPGMILPTAGVVAGGRCTD